MNDEFAEDAGARLTQLVARRTLEPTRFAAAARLAGQHLESVKPVVVGMTPGNMIFAGSAAAVAPGTILVVLADEQRVFSVYVRALDDDWIGDVDAAADHVQQRLPRPWEPIDTIKTIAMVLDEHGVPLGARTKDLRQTTLNNIVGSLFLGIDLELRRELCRMWRNAFARESAPRWSDCLPAAGKRGSGSGRWRCRWRPTSRTGTR
jgi:hypothetical protein